MDDRKKKHKGKISKEKEGKRTGKQVGDRKRKKRNGNEINPHQSNPVIELIKKTQPQTLKMDKLFCGCVWVLECAGEARWRGVAGRGLEWTASCECPLKTPQKSIIYWSPERRGGGGAVTEMT